MGSLSPVFLLAPVRAEPFSKPAIIEFRSQLEEAESGGQAARAADDNVQPSRPPPGARARRMSMQEYDMPRGAESFRAYGAQRIAGVRTASISEWTATTEVCATVHVYHASENWMKRTVQVSLELNLTVPATICI